MASSTVTTSRATLTKAAQMFLHDVAEVAGYGAHIHGNLRRVSNYVMRRPILTVPDPWFFAGLIALEAAKICDLFPPREAAVLLRQISEEADGLIGRRGRAVSRLAFALMGRLGFGAVILHMKVPDHRISDIILLMMGDRKTWRHLLPTRTAHRQVRAALKTGAPSWWQDYCSAHAAAKNASTRTVDNDATAPELATLTALPEPPLESAHAF
ncbi:MAG: hypothetical protein EPO08_07050 [Rhodospirillaceae bacterium]|nr:MAG: hypothetical protein EPO08_07050 [Rhodospirillaceae bacterium]